MKITSRRLSIPPYISCSWEQVSSLHVEEYDDRRDLVVFMSGGAKVTIPHLSETLIDMIFAAHGEFLDHQGGPISPTPTFQIEGTLPPGAIALPMTGGVADIMQHNPAHKDMPELSHEVLQRVIGMVKMIAPDEIQNIPPSEPHCNCIHCQISRAVSDDAPEQISDEIVSDEDLKFRDWEVSAEGDNLFVVRHPLNTDEEYHVYLGDPIGCTCGSKQCEHIAAALRS